MVLRKAGVNDIDLLVRLRFDYLSEDRGSLPDRERDAMQKQLHEYFRRHMADDTFVAILAEADGKTVSAAYLAVCEKPANPSFINGKTGTVLNVFTYPQYRGKGIAGQVMKRVIGEAKRLGVTYLELSATSGGKPLYEKLGFRISTYAAMNMKLDEQPEHAE